MGAVWGRVLMRAQNPSDDPARASDSKITLSMLSRLEPNQYNRISGALGRKYVNAALGG